MNALLDTEADRLCNAQRHERSTVRRDMRAGHYERKLQTKAGEARLRIPKLRRQTFETAIIERYRRRESLVEVPLIEIALSITAISRTLIEGTWLKMWRYQCTMQRCQALCLRGGALAAHPHQQAARAHPARDQAAHPRGRPSAPFANIASGLE